MRWPLTYKSCKLYGLQSKKTLREWLGIDDASFFHSKNISINYHPYISNKGGVKRLIEASSSKLQSIQTKILVLLRNLDYPEYLFSGLKGISFIDNAKQHLGKYYTYKIDISKFFPNTSRNKVYNFFRKNLNTSPDVATILTNCTTVNLYDYRAAKKYDEIVNYLEETNIKQIAHLATGAPTSMLLSFLANQQMFEELSFFCKQRNYIFTVYADDVTISSLNPIPYKNRNVIIRIVEKYGHFISKRKVKYYNFNQNKKITGVVINKNGELCTPNKLLNKTHNKILKYKNKNIDERELNSLKGCVNVANQIDKKFQHLKQVLNNK